MATDTQLAAMAYNAYTPEADNVIATGFAQIDQRPRAGEDTNGFGAVVYRGGSDNKEIVIAFRGTDTDSLGSLTADFVYGNSAAFGVFNSHLRMAIELIADTQRQNPGASISLTGHSLGGGIASVMAIFFGMDAFVVGTAPFGQSTLGLVVEKYWRHYEQYLQQHGGTVDAKFDEYAHSGFGMDELYEVREQRVRGQYVDGEILEPLRAAWPVMLTVAATNTPIVIGPTPLSTLELHSSLLHAVLIASPRLAEVANVSPALLALLRDPTLYSRDGTANPDILVRLLQDRINATGSDLLTLFAEDALWTATGGSVSMTDLNRGLLSILIERYMNVDATSATPFFTRVSNGIQFDLSSFTSAENIARPRLYSSLAAIVGAEASSLVQFRAAVATQWHVQNGSNGLFTFGAAASEVQVGARDQLNELRGGAGDDILINGNAGGVLEGGTGSDVLVGGNGSDSLRGGDHSDHLYGGGGVDFLLGEFGDDFLYGGAGVDEYRFINGDGDDVILDSDNLGRIFVNGVEVQGGTRQAPNVWFSADGSLWITQQLIADDRYTLVINNASISITIENWTAGAFGISLSGQVPGRTADSVVPLEEPGPWPQNFQFIGTGSARTYLDFDNLVGGADDDRMFGFEGNDSLEGEFGEDYLDGGSGNDLLLGGLGSDRLIGGAGADFILGDLHDAPLGGAVGHSEGVVYEPLDSNSIVHWYGFGWGVEEFAGERYVWGLGAGYEGGTTDYIDGGAGEDQIFSGDGDDVVDGGADNDGILGGAGDDTIQGGTGDDLMYGDGQQDQVQTLLNYTEIMTQGNDVIHGGDGNDIAVGGGGADRLFGDAGNDDLYGDSDDDSVLSFPTGHGDDYLSGGAGVDRLYGGGGSDQLVGGAGNDLLAGDGFAVDGATHGDDVLEGESGEDSLYGHGGDDHLFGGADNDRLFGDNDAVFLDPLYHGDDYLSGGGGQDVLVGGGGADRLFGGADNDRLFGDQATPGLTGSAQGNDIIDGEAGDDEIGGGGGNDVLIGGDGDDLVHGDDEIGRTPGAAHGNDTIYLGAGDDQAFGSGGDDYVEGGAGDDDLSGDSLDLDGEFHGRDVIDGGHGKDRIWGDGGNDVLRGGDGDDIILGDYPARPELVGDDVIDGGAGDDQLFGNAGNDVITGGLGIDVMDGGAGADILNGGDGGDSIYGADGDDEITGGTGSDYLAGGAGNDTYVFDTTDFDVANGTIDTIVDAAGENRIMFRSLFTPTNVVLYSGAIDGMVFIENGDEGGAIAIGDALSGSVRSFVFSNGIVTQAHRLIGQRFLGLASRTNALDNSYLLGGMLDDQIAATGMNATLAGGAGNDTLTGGAGSTTYLFGFGDGVDVINDTSTFTSSDGANKNVLRLDEGISLGSLSLSYESGATYLALNVGAWDQVRLTSIDVNNIANGTRTFDEIAFANGQTLSWQALLANLRISIRNTGGLATLTGTSSGDDILGGAGADTILAGAGNDIIDGGAGDDVLSGQAGNDVYRFGRNSGRDSIVNADTDAAAIDSIEFAGDILPSQVTFIRIGDDLLAAINDTSDRLTVRNYYANESVEQIRFANGTVYAPANVPALTSQLVATAGNDLLIGTAAGDTIDGLAGIDEIYGGQGDDTLTGGAERDLIYGGEGMDTITDADGQNDAIFGEGGADVITGDGVLDGGAGNDVITSSGSLSSSTLLGGAGDDTLRSGGGFADRLDGGGGNDTYIVDRLFGRSDRIVQNDTGPGKIDRIRFGAGILPANVSFQGAADGSLVVQYGTSSTLVIEGFLLEAGNARKVDEFIFNDAPGTVLTGAGIEAQVMTPTSISNFIRGTAGDDVIDALGGDDTVYGGAGNDTLYGGGVGFQNNDQLYGEDGNDTLIDGTRSDGGNGDDIIRGGGGMLGGAGDDRLEVISGRGASMEGGLGSDTYVIGRGGAQFQLTGVGNGQNLDTDPTSLDVLQFVPGIGVADVEVRRAGDSLELNVLNRWGLRERSVNITGYFDVESTHLLDEIRFASDPGVVWRFEQMRAMVQTGTSGDDELRGGDGDEMLQGLAGDDHLIGNDGSNDLSGGAGNDLYWGGHDSDTYRFGRGDGYDEIQESGGDDTVAFGTGISASDVVFYRTSSEGHLSSQFSSNADDLVAVVNGTREQLRIANYFSDTEPRWSVERFTFADGTVLSSGEVRTRLINVAGTRNSLTGTVADDTFVADHRDDSFWDVEDGGGVDIVLSSVTYWLRESEIENLTLTGNLNINATGNELDNIIRGNSGDNIIYAGIDGGWRAYGADTYIGGAGNDTYYLDCARGTTYAGYADTNDIVIENSNEGYDTVVYAGYSVTLAANVERLVLWTYLSSFDPATVPPGTDSRPRARGNELNNVIDASEAGWPATLVIDGGAGADEMIAGLSGQTFVIDDAGDVIRFRALGDPFGNVETYISYTAPDFIRNVAVLGSGAITATGNALANVLDGSRNTAANTLTGGLGDDTYIVDSSDLVIESAEGGTDTVQSGVNIVLHDNVENLTLTGSLAANGFGNALANRITGNSAANLLDGGLGADQLIGGAGDDIYIIDAADILTEVNNGGTDEIRVGFDYQLATNFENLTLLGSAVNATGNSAANVIRGNAGANLIDGGTGTDRMIGGGGNDVYRVNVTTDMVEEAAGEGIDLVESIATFTLSAHVENLTLLNSSQINGTGNTLDNVLTGNSANNTLTGDAGNDTLDGGGGMDIMRGGAGNDIYVVAQTNDSVQENAGEGTDLVRSSVTYTLTTDVENLTLTGTSAINGIGNILANVITGSDFNNTLTGNAGNDTLIGGNGADIYSYSTGHGSDTIDNFSTDTAQDRLNVTNMTRSQVTFTRSANDLVMTRNGTATDSVRVTGWFSVTGNQLNFVQFTDQTLTAAQINALFPAAAAAEPADVDISSATPSFVGTLLQFIDAMNHFGTHNQMILDDRPTDHSADERTELALTVFDESWRHVHPERTAML